MPPYILGLHASHNASACIGDESGLIYAIQEERLTGEKNFWGFPRLSIKACLDRVGIGPDDLLATSYGGNQVICRYHTREDVLFAYRRQATMVGRLRQRVAIPLIAAIKPNFGQGRLRTLLGEAGFHDTTVSHHDHHLSHAATAYFGLRSSPAEKYLVLTADGAGDRLSGSVRVWGAGKCEEIALTPEGDSLGAIYTWVTYGMGFVPLEHEYKLMGMGPYASDKAAEETAKIFWRYLRLRDDGLAFQRGTRRQTHFIYDQLEHDLRGMRFDYICAGLQRFTEDLLCEWVRHAVRATGVRKVVAAGGVFMNVKANKRIAELPEVESFEAFPSCGDETLSIGAYYLESAKRFGDATVKPLEHFYLADAPEEQDVIAAIKESGFQYERPADIADAVAKVLAEGQPVARCAGPMEFGARALGNRSILADPKSQDIVRVINRMVKKRDFWMPFAPMVKQERQHDYIKNPKNLRSPFMMMTFDSRENFRELIAAIHNADLTCRAKILAREHNPPMHDILNAFERRTGGGVILNTSFNLHGYPIVRTAAEALAVLRDSGLEYLQVGDYLVSKQARAISNGAPDFVINMADSSPRYRLGIISCLPAAPDGQGGLLCNHSIGRLLDLLRESVPGAKLCLPLLAEPQSNMRHTLSFPAEDIFPLPPLKSVIRSQIYYFRTRHLIKRFAREADVLFIRLPFQLPSTLLGLGTPKLLHVVGNPYKVIVASSDYQGLMKKLALWFAAHSNHIVQRMVTEPHTRVATNGAEMWDVLGCREGRVVVSSCLYEREMRPRENRALGDPPRLLFVGYLRPEKGIHDLLDAFEQIRARRPLKLTLVGGSDKGGSAEAAAHDRIRSSRFRDDITVTGMLDFGESLFELYRNHDVFVLPSLSEGTPRTLVEARSFGCPAVATRVGGIPSSLHDGQNGLLVEPHDPHGLAAAIERILDDEPLRMRLIDAGLQDAPQQSVEYFVGQLVEELNILAQGTGKGTHVRLGSV